MTNQRSSTISVAGSSHVLKRSNQRSPTTTCIFLRTLRLLHRRHSHDMSAQTVLATAALGSLATYPAHATLATKSLP